MDQTKPNVAESSDIESGVEILSASDSIDGTDTFILADIAAENTWIAMSADAVVDLDDHR